MVAVVGGEDDVRIVEFAARRQCINDLLDALVQRLQGLQSGLVLEIDGGDLGIGQQWEVPDRRRLVAEGGSGWRSSTPSSGTGGSPVMRSASSRDCANGSAVGDDRPRERLEIGDSLAEAGSTRCFANNPVLSGLSERCLPRGVGGPVGFTWR
jgi:hypothetical protein